MRLHVVVQRVADRRAPEAVGQRRSAPPAPRRARRHRCGRRRCWRTGAPWFSCAAAASSTSCTESPVAWRCQPTNGPPSYSSSSAHRGISPSACRAAPGGRAGKRGVQRGAPGEAGPGQPQRALAASDRQLAVQHRAGRAGALGRLGRQHFERSRRHGVNVPGQGSNARTWRSIASASRRPVDPAVLARQLRRVGRAVVRLRHRAAGPPPVRAGSAARRSRPARRAGWRRWSCRRSAPPRAAASGRYPGRHPSA